MPIGLALPGRPLRGDASGGLRVAPTPFTKKGAELYQSAAHMLYGLRFEKYGTFRFRVVHNDQVLASVPLTIMPPPMMAAA
jgi:hypothetical protein